VTNRRLILERQPRFIPLSDYGRAAAEIDGLLESMPGVVAVYRIGSVSAPGISDLDRVAVVEKSGRFPTVWGRLSENTRYVAMHSPFLVDVETFVRHRWFAVAEPLELVAGTQFVLEAPPSSELLGAIAGIEGLVVSRLKLAKQLCIGRIKVRPFLCEMHNLRHDLRLMGASAAEAPRAWALTAEVLAVRGGWWDAADHERDGRVIELASSAPIAIDEALARWSSTTAETATVDALPLSTDWANITLASQAIVSMAPQGGGLSPLMGRVSRRAAEFVWRHERHQLALPPAVVSLLSAAAAGADELLAERLEVVQRYKSFLDAQDPGWSSIGLAGIFTSG